jgi:hypothetical protein
LVSLLLLAPAIGAAENRVPLPSGGSIRYSGNASQTRLTISAAGKKSQRVFLARDSTVAAKSAPSDVRIVAEFPGKVLILVDTYPSIPGGMSYCRAGKESFLRAVAIAGTPPKETLRIKLESCLQGIELTGPGVEWDPASATLRIHWLTGPSQKDKPEERTIRFGPDGAPVEP